MRPASRARRNPRWHSAANDRSALTARVVAPSFPTSLRSSFAVIPLVVTATFTLKMDSAVNNRRASHFLCPLLLLLPQARCFAQVDRVSLSGTVLDGRDARVPGAKVTALQIATGLVHETESSGNGVYVIPELPIGLYRVSCSAPGFRQVVFENLEQTVRRTGKLDITLAIGGITQQVNVSGVTHSLTRRPLPSALRSNHDR